MTFLSERERQTLQHLCETLVAVVPEGAAPSAVSAYHPPELGAWLEEALEVVSEPADQRELKLLLRAFELGAFNGLTSGTWQSVSRMSQAEREALLFKWADSRFALRRKAFQGIKRLALFMAYANPPDEQAHPMWPEIEYSGPPGPAADAPRSIHPLQIRSSDTLSADVLIIGSGAGGGVLAGELSAAGQDVLVVEKGGYHNESDFNGNERQSTEHFFEKRGALTSSDTTMMILAGSTLGGGTVVNWTASFRPPDYVLEEWARDYGFSEATSSSFQQSLDAVSQRMNVNTDESPMNANNRLFAQGCERLGYQTDVTPRNVRGCEECGFCNYGCSFGAKQSTLKTYLQDAQDRGARIMVEAQVQRILHSQGHVTGAEMLVRDADGQMRQIQVRAPRVVVAAGSLHTPALLLRSGLSNPNIGANLHLHPTTVIFSLFDEEVRPWQGVAMSRVNKQFTNLDGQGYGVTLEVAPAHPGLTGSTLPWRSAAEHKALLSQIHRMGNIIAITRDKFGGRVRLDAQGQPRIDYALHQYDAAHMMRGMIEALRIHHAAGARQVYSSHSSPMGYDASTGGDFEAFLAKVEARGLAPNAFALFSAHQMSSCRIGGSAAQGAIDPGGQSYEVKGLFVADGSVLPTASGVNPMLTIMGTAHYIAQQIRSHLN